MSSKYNIGAEDASVSIVTWGYFKRKQAANTTIAQLL
jgi:hypothetical protein